MTTNQKIKNAIEEIKQILNIENVNVEITADGADYYSTAYAELGFDRYMLDFIATNKTDKIGNICASCLSGNGKTVLTSLKDLITDCKRFKQHGYILTFSEYN